ncbi:MAG: phosphoribosylformylglycinamidine cyclo-ligase [Deltaproteobacteria bacterium]|nr:phosphoribosylformylglycinamidine cyclo-ligase [Deltaproteobacteria bacterium]
MDQKSKYAMAGVDIDQGNRLVDRIKPIAKATFSPSVITDIGGFAGLYSLNVDRYERPVLISSTDGVGTKLKVAIQMDKHDTVGIDLVAMCVNDIVVQGGKPLFMLDYLAMGKLDTDKAEAIIKGIATGCLAAKCSLIGGETAEMPGLYAEGDYDLAGFVVGVVDNDKIIDGSSIGVGNQLLGVASSGLHSNGYSLVRKIFFDQLNWSTSLYVPELNCTLGEELLKPTKIYVELLMNLCRDWQLHGIAHITGGGITDNLPRVLPGSCRAVIKRHSWPAPPIFDLIKTHGQIPDEEMLRTFNNGLGLIIVVSEKDTADMVQRIKALNEEAYVIGTIEERPEGSPPIEFID